MSNLHFTPIEREVMLDPHNYLLFKFSSDLKLDYVNTYFTEFTGYEIEDVVGMSVEILNTDSTPRVISNMITQSVNKRENINLIIKNKTKDGRIYWFITDFSFNIDDNDQLISFSYYRKLPSRSAIPALHSLYTKLLEIENYSSEKVAEKYLNGFLEEKKMSFIEYTAHLSKGEDFTSLLSQTQTPKKKSFFGKLFGS